MDNPPVVKFLKEIGFEEDQETLTLHRFETHQLYFIEEGLEAVVVNQQTQNALQNQNPSQNRPKGEEKSPFLPSNIKFP